jgi:hypothetical protein
MTLSLSSTVRVLAVLLASLAASSVEADLVVYSPSTLADFQASGTVVSQIEGGFASSQITDPSNESPNVFTATNSISSPGQVSYTHDLAGATFDPASLGLITGIRFSIEVRDPGLASNDTAIHFGIRQGSRLYYFSETGTNRFAFRNEDTPTFLAYDKQGLQATDFAYFLGGPLNSLDGSDHPDFSLQGDSLQFLIGTASGTSGSNPVRISEFRNSRIEISFAAIPEPTATLFFAIFSVATATRWRSRL